jgi:hypothetical protein
MDDKTWELKQRYPGLYITHYHIDSRDGTWIRRDKGLSWLFCPPGRDSFFDHTSHVGSLAAVTKRMRDYAKRGYFSVMRYY